MIEHQPEASGVVKKNQREYDRERHPDPELLVDGYAGQNIEEKEARHSDRNCRSIIDVNCANEIPLLTFIFQAAVRTMSKHFKRFRVQLSQAAAWAAQP